MRVRLLVWLTLLALPLAPSAAASPSTGWLEYVWELAEDATPCVRLLPPGLDDECYPPALVMRGR